MKTKNIIYITVFILLLAAILVFYKWFSNQPCPAPEKPSDVTEGSIWKGGCDGGNWIEFVETRQETIRFRVYRDWNGDLILDARFKYQDCDSFKMTANNWPEYIAYFDNTLILYDKNAVPEKCILTPVDIIYQETVE